MQTPLDHEDVAALTVALDSACDARALPGLASGGAAAIRELLSAALSQLATEGLRDSRSLCAAALSRVTPSAAYYARQVR